MTEKGLNFNLLLILGVFFLFGAVCPGSALVTTFTTETSIKWNYSDLMPVTQLSLDGVNITANTATGFYILSDLQSNETHALTVYGTTTETTEATTQKKLIDKTLEVYLLLIIAVLFLIASVWIRLLSFMAVIFSTLGIITTIQNNFIQGMIFVTILLISIASLGYEK